MKRKITDDLLKWKNSADRLPLVLHGARQVGKTYVVSDFGKENYDQLVYVNFESNERLKAIFDIDLNPKRIIDELSIYLGKRINENTSLLFFDEIQSCEKALTSLKYFAEELPNVHIIAAGSLLGVAINRENYSFPVGKVCLKTLYPLTFEEFLWAIDAKEAADIIQDCFEKNMQCSLHELMLEKFRLYLSIGGMPRVLANYLQAPDFDLSDLAQRDIVDAYIADMVKSTSSSESIKIMSAYKSVPSQLAKENKKFQYKVIRSGARSSQYETAIDWLVASGVVQKCIKISHGTYPLMLHADNASFKLYLSDVGLLRNRLGVLPAYILTQHEQLNQIKGAMTENYVANNLQVNGYNLFYWESEGKAELDFVIQKNNGVCVPIEVKSSENVKAKSLREYMNKYNVEYAIRVSTKNFGFENSIKSVPLYAVWCI